jgi:hypothetical protein
MRFSKTVLRTLLIVMTAGSISSAKTISFPGANVAMFIFLQGVPGISTTPASPIDLGPVGTICNLDIDGTFVDGGFSFGRQQVMVSVTVPPKSASLHHTFAMWGIAGSAAFLLLCWTRRNPAPFIAILLMGAFIASCGGGSKNNTPAPPTGTNSLVITVTPNVGTAHTLTVPLAVQ